MKVMIIVDIVMTKVINAKETKTKEREHVIATRVYFGKIYSTFHYKT